MKKLKDNEISLLMDFTGVPAGILLQVLFTFFSNGDISTETVVFCLWFPTMWQMAACFFAIRYKRNIFFIDSSIIKPRSRSVSKNNSVSFKTLFFMWTICKISVPCSVFNIKNKCILVQQDAFSIQPSGMRQVKFSIVNLYIRNYNRTIFKIFKHFILFCTAQLIKAIQCHHSSVIKPQVIIMA